MKHLVLIGVIFSLTGFYSCNSDDANTPKAEPSTYEVAALRLSPPPSAKYDMVTDNFFEPDNTVSVPDSVDKKKIIKDGKMSVKVSDVEQGKKSIDALVKKFNGYYEREEFINNDRMNSFDLRIRIPSVNFENILSGVEEGIGEVISKNIYSRDVTEEFIDVQTRLINKKNYLKRYNELLSKAASVEDIIKIEENVRTLQEEIESKEGRLKYLTDQVEYSTLNVHLFKEVEYIFKSGKEDRFTERLKSSLNNGWKGIVNFTLWLIQSWPLLILAVGIIFGWRRYSRRKRTVQNS
jgi:hypothetical protein